jgi:hypothetical protein
MTYGYVNAFPLVFPCKERMLAGENPATLVAGDWRRWSNFRPEEVADGSLSEFLTGKQIKIVLLQSMYPSFKGHGKSHAKDPFHTRTENCPCARSSPATQETALS